MRSTRQIDGTLQLLDGTFTSMSLHERFRVSELCRAHRHVI